MRWIAIACMLAGGCDPAEQGEDIDASAESDDGGEPDCENGPVVTYDTFGRGFLAGYCNGCHGAAVVDRQGAPPDVVLDDRDVVSAYGDRILARVLPEDEGLPAMPPAGGVTPEDSERLIVWLTCWP
jgi:hypothetical protein